MRTKIVAPIAAVILCLGMSSCSPSTPTQPSGATPKLAGIAVVQWEGLIRVGDLATNTSVALTPDWDGGEQVHPDWSPDGLSVAFAADSSDGTRDIWIADVETGTAKLAFDCTEPCVWADEPAWSPDRTSIVVEQGTDSAAGGIGTLEVMEASGANKRTVFTTEPAEYPYGPRWSPDGSKLVFETIRFATTDVMESRTTANWLSTVDVATGVSAPLTTEDEGATYPDWSPDGELVLYGIPLDSSNPDGPADLWTAPADGSGEPSRLTNFAEDGSRAIEASWTPDGSAAIFVYEKVPFSDPTTAFVSADGKSVSLDSEVNGTHPRLKP